MRTVTSRSVACALALLILAASCPSASGQRQAWQDDGFAFRRTIELPPTAEPPAIAVVDFFAHGVLEHGDPIAVFSRREEVPSRVLQLGPGDFCRVAFQPTTPETRYQIYYGGRAQRARDPLPWTAVAGLRLETRRWRDCDLSDLASLRATFPKAPVFGSDFVAEVYHRHNPFDLTPRPFLSHYVGDMLIPQTGRYTFYTSSQDCSFVLIDGQVVVAAPGRHEPESQGRIKGEMELTEGLHRFEYWHAASGPETCMTVFWQLPGLQNLSRISPNVFGFQRVVHLPGGNLEHREDGPVPDFRVAVVGEIPSPDDGPAMIRAQMADITAASVASLATRQWSFGDGQTSEEVNPGHVFLRPGVYPIALNVTRRSTVREIVHRVPIARPIRLSSDDPPPEDLQAYIKLLEHYNAQQLDPRSLQQMVRAYLDAGDPARAAEAGRAALASGSQAYSDEVRYAIARMIGPALRYQLDQPGAAAEVWATAARLVSDRGLRVHCAVEAADALVNDALAPGEAAALLDAASQDAGSASSEVLSYLHRVRGDWHARRGDAREARRSYQQAAEVLDLPYNSVERNAWRGAHSRSVEAYLRESQWEQARQELNTWQNHFPLDKCEGYLPLLQANYWFERQKYPQAAAVANDALVVNPNSPYADQLTLLIGRCAEELGQRDKAATIYQALATEYPGSPLVPAARQRLLELAQPPAAAPGPERRPPPERGSR